MEEETEKKYNRIPDGYQHVKQEGIFRSKKRNQPTPPSPSDTVSSFLAQRVSSGKPGEKGLGSEQGSQPFQTTWGILISDSTNLPEQTQCASELGWGPAAVPLQMKHIRWLVPAARDPRTFLGLHLSGSLKMSGQVCFL